MAANEPFGNNGPLDRKVAELGVRVDDLVRRLEVLESARSIAGVEQTVDYDLAPDSNAERLMPDEKGLWTWIGKNSVLPRIAAVCFMLVVALLLRTATDNGWVGPRLGTILGISYMVALLSVGWRQYAASHRLAPVFSGCGLVLLFSIIAESRHHFSVLPFWLGSVLLITASTAAMAIALRYRARFLLWMAVMGAVLVVLVFDFPNIALSTAAIIMLVAVFASMRAADSGLANGLRWVVLLTVFFFFFIWGFKLSHAVKNFTMIAPISSLSPAVFAAWYLPALLCFSFLLPGITSFRLLRGATLDPFYHVLPLAGASIFVLGGQVALVSWLKGPVLMGISSCIFTFLLLSVIRFRLHQKKKQGGDQDVTGLAALGMAAALLSFASLYFLAGNLLRTQIFLPFVFVAFLAMSFRSGSGNMRLLAVVLALATMAIGIRSEVFPAGAAPGISNWLAVLNSVVCGMGAYFWCRKNTPPHNGFYLHYDHSDHTAALFLAYGLVSLYSLAALLLASFYGMLRLDPSGLSCGRSILINIGAAVLIVWGTMIRKSKEIAAAGILVALIGGGKVFLSDLFHAHGLPLVLSVSSFGALTAFCSLVLSNWQNMCGQDGQNTATKTNIP